MHQGILLDVWYRELGGRHGTIVSLKNLRKAHDGAFSDKRQSKRCSNIATLSGVTASVKTPAGAFERSSSLLTDAGALVYARHMPRRGPLYQLRSFIAGLFGISNEQASDGSWWEIDFIIVILAGAVALGFLAWL